RCTEDAGAPAYWPWVQVLRAWVEDCAGDELGDTLGDVAGEIARLVPRVRELLGDVPEGPRLDPEEARFRLFDAIAVFLRRAAGRDPLIVVIDDLQSADDGSLKLLAHLAQELRSTAVVVIAACREIGSSPP